MFSSTGLLAIYLACLEHDYLPSYIFAGIVILLTCGYTLEGKRALHYFPAYFNVVMLLISVSEVSESPLKILLTGIPVVVVILLGPYTPLGVEGPFKSLHPNIMKWLGVWYELFGFMVYGVFIVQHGRHSSDRPHDQRMGGWRGVLGFGLVTLAYAISHTRVVFSSPKLNVLVKCAIFTLGVMMIEITHASEIEPLKIPYYALRRVFADASLFIVIRMLCILYFLVSTVVEFSVCSNLGDAYYAHDIHELEAGSIILSIALGLFAASRLSNLLWVAVGALGVSGLHYLYTPV